MLDGEKEISLFWSLSYLLETVVSLKKGIEFIGVCLEPWQNATWKLSQKRL